MLNSLHSRTGEGRGKGGGERHTLVHTHTPNGRIHVIRARDTVKSGQIIGLAAWAVAVTSRSICVVPLPFEKRLFSASFELTGLSLCLRISTQ